MAKETSSFTSKQELQDYINSLKQIDAQYRELNRQAKLLASTPGAAKNAVLEQIKALRIQYDTHKEILASIKKAEAELKSFTKEADKAAKALESQAKAADNLKDDFSELNTFQKSITRRYGEQSDETKRINKNVDAIKVTVGGIGRFLKKNVNLEEDQRDALIEASEYLKSMPSSFDKLNRQLSRGTINQKKYNQYAAELNDNWEEILDKINDSDKTLKGFKKSLKGIGTGQGLSGQAALNYEKLVKEEYRRQEAGMVASAALSPIPGGEGVGKLIEARELEKQEKGSGAAKLARAAGAIAIGAGVGEFISSMRYYIPLLSKFLNQVSNKWAPDLAYATGEVNVQQAIFNRNFKLTSGPLAKQYGKGMYYAVEATKNFQFQMKDLANEFNKASKTAFLGRGIGSIGYNAAQMQLAGVSAESVASALTDIASTSNVNFFGTTLGSQAAVFSREMGISTQSIGEIMAAFRRIDGSSGKTALNMVYTSAKMADIQKINPAVILQDMAEASGKMLSYNIKNAQAFAQQAIAVRQMGGQLPKFAQGITGSILNYRQSLQAQISLSNMLNRPVDFSVAQSLAYQGKYAEAYQNIQQSGVLQAVRRAGPLAAAQFEQIFGMGIDEFQARAEGKTGVGLASSLGAETKGFLGRVSGAEQAFQIKAAQISFDKAIVDAQFAQKLATEMEKDPAYRKAVNRLADTQAAANAFESILSKIIPALTSVLAYYGLGKLPFFKGGTTTPAASMVGNPYGFVDKNGKPLTMAQSNMKLTAGGTRTVEEGLKAMGFTQGSKMANFGSNFKSGLKGTAPFAVVGAGLDFYNRKQMGQTNMQAGLGSIIPTLAGAGTWAAASAVAPETFGLSLLLPLGASIVASYLTGKGVDKLTGADKPQIPTAQTQQVQTAIDSSTQMLTVMKNIELLVADIAGYQATPATVQMIMDGKDISNSLIKHTQNTRGTNPRTTLRQSLGMYK